MTRSREYQAYAALLDQLLAARAVEALSEAEEHAYACEFDPLWDAMGEDERAAIEDLIEERKRVPQTREQRLATLMMDIATSSLRVMVTGALIAVDVATAGKQTRHVRVVA